MDIHEILRNIRLSTMDIPRNVPRIIPMLARGLRLWIDYAKSLVQNDLQSITGMS